MIAITNVLGLTLELVPGQALVTEQVCAWTADDELPGEFSYPIKFPLNESNLRFLQLQFRPDSTHPEMELPVTVNLEGVLYRRCLLSYRIVDDKGDGFLKIDSSEAYDKLRNLSLLEALPDRIHLGDGIQPGGQLSLKTLRQRMYELAQLKPGLFPCVFFPIRNDSFFEADITNEYENTRKVPGFVRQVYVNAFNGQFLTDSSTVTGYPICPQFYLSWVLERIMNLAGYRIEGNFLSDPEVQMLTVTGMTAMEVKRSITAPLGHTVTAGMHLPDMSVSDFLKAIKGRYGLAITFNANTRICTIVQFKKTVQSGTVQDLTAYQTGRYSVDKALDRGFRVIDFIDEQDELYKDAKGNVVRPAPFVIGKGLDELQLRCGTTQAILEASPIVNAAQAGGHWIVPTVKQAGNTVDGAYQASERYLDQEGKRKNNIGLKLISYRGMSVDTKGNAYPLGTPDIRNGKQEPIGKQSTSLGGRSGLWRSGLRDYYHFRDQAQPITQPLLLPVAVLAQLKLHEPVGLTLKDQIRRSYLVTKLSAESPGSEGRVRVRLECLTLPSGLELSAEADLPLVWVSMAVTHKSVTDPPAGVPAYHIETTVTLSFWANAQKTQPYITQGLAVTLRQRKDYRYDARLGPFGYGSDPRAGQQFDYLTTVVCNGSSMVLPTPFVTEKREYDSTKRIIDQYKGFVQLDPGDDYNVIV
ncbi:hypothetical protein [Fibrisoma montanum]|nr:hypothetical protein [Fibrisoma montanum]